MFVSAGQQSTMSTPDSALQKLQGYFRNEERIAQWHFFLLGAAMLLPWNAFITAVDYLGQIFPGQHIDRVFSVVYMSVNIVSIALNFLLQRHVSIPTRMVVGLLGYVFAMVAVPIADEAAGADVIGLPTFKMVLVVGVLLSAFFDGLVQPAVFGEAAVLPVACIQVRSILNGCMSGENVTPVQLVAHLCQLKKPATCRQQPQVPPHRVS